MGRHELAVHRTIQAPADAVWAVLVDLKRYPQWMSHVTRAEAKTAGAMKVGSRFRLTTQTTNHKMVSDVEATVVDRGRRFAWRHLSDELDGAPFTMMGDAVSEMALEADGASTRVEARLSFTAKGIAAKLGAGVFLHQRVKPQFEQTLSQLAALCEKKR